MKIKEAFDREKISMTTDSQSIVIENLDQVADKLAKVASAERPDDSAG